MSFDTTAVNKGRINGAYISLEEFLNIKLLWLACRYHNLGCRGRQKKHLVEVQQDRMFCYSSALRLFGPKNERKNNLVNATMSKILNHW